MSNGFEFSTSAELAEGSGNYIDTAGIYKGVTLINVEFGELSEKVEGRQLIWTFQDASGAIYRHAEFEPNRAEMIQMQKKWNSGKKISNRELEEKAEAMWKAQMQRISHLLKAYLPEDRVKIKAKDWNSFGKEVVARSGENFKGELFDIKLVYNNKGKVTFPRYVKGAGFIRNQAGVEPELGVDTKDNMTKPAKAPSDVPGISTDLTDLETDAEDNPFEETSPEKEVPGHVTGDDAGFEDDRPEEEESDEDALDFLK